MDKNEIITTIENTGDLLLGPLSNEFDTYEMEKETKCSATEIRAAALALYVCAKYIKDDESADIANFAAAISSTINRFRDTKIEND